MTRSIKSPLPDEALRSDIQFNCDVSDARDHGIYSMCSMVLKLRGLYKWEKGLEPWQEPEPAELLDWIEAKEHYWQGLAESPFRVVRLQGECCDAHDVAAINAAQAGSRLFYGAGHGRSMKAIFFLSEIVERFERSGCPVLLLGCEYAREMAAPFAMVQDDQVVIRTDPLRFFLYDHIQELRSSCRSSYRFFLNHYGLLKEDGLDQERLPPLLDRIVAGELDLFIYHEIGEMLETALGRDTLKSLAVRFPGSVIEFVCRAIKDILADTHPRGLLNHIISQEKASSLALYLCFLDGLRAELFGEIRPAWNSFLERYDWQVVRRASDECRARMLVLAEKITAIGEHDGLRDEEIQQQFKENILVPLGLDIPAP